MEMGFTHMSITSLLFNGNSFSSTGDLNSRDLGTSDILFFFFFLQGKKIIFHKIQFFNSIQFNVWH